MISFHNRAIHSEVTLGSGYLPDNIGLGKVVEEP